MKDLQVIDIMSKDDIKAVEKELRFMSKGLNAWLNVMNSYKAAKPSAFKAYLKSIKVNERVATDKETFVATCKGLTNSNGSFALPKWIADNESNRELFKADILAESTIKDKKTSEEVKQIKVLVPLVNGFTFAQFKRFMVYGSGQNVILAELANKANKANKADKADKADKANKADK